MHLTRQNCWWSKKVKKCDLHLATHVSHIPLQFLRFYRKKMCVFPVRLIKHLTVWIYRSDSPVPLFVWLVDWLKKYSDYTEAAQSGRMYYLEGFCQYRPPCCSSAPMISHVQYWIPFPPFTSLRGIRHSYGNGFLYNLVESRNSTATV